VATAFALLVVAACSDSPTKGGSHNSAATVAVTAGNQQVGNPGAALATPVAVRVTNSQGDPLVGQTVTFAVTRGGGSVASPSVTSDNSGLAQTTWTLGSGAVRQSLKASAGSATALATATVDTTHSLYLMAERDTVSLGDTIWLNVIAQTTGLPGEVRGAVQESFVNHNPSAAQLIRLTYYDDTRPDLAGTDANFVLLTSAPTNSAARQRYFLIGYKATQSGEDIAFGHDASGFIGARTFTDLLSRVSVVGTVVHIR